MRARQSRPRLIQAMIDAFSLPDLRQKLLITLGVLVAFRFVAHVPVAGVNVDALRQLFERNALLGMLDLFSGGAMRNFSVAAMGVYPFITASIILQLMTPIIPKLQALSQEGEAGRNKMVVITYWMTVPLAALSGYGQLVLLQRSNPPVIASMEVLQTVSIVLSMIAGTMFLIWLGEIITDYGIGNGLSIIIFAGIVTSIPQMIGQGVLAGRQGQILGLIFYVLVTLATIVAIVIFTEAQRRIPVQFAKQVVRGGRMYRQSGTSHIPLRVNTAGMIPVIFASSMTLFPSVIASYFANAATEEPNLANDIVNIFKPDASIPLGLVYWGLLFLLTIGFAFFYTTVLMEQQDLPGNLQRQGGFVPGIRPGKRTADYLGAVIGRITWAGAIFLAVVAIIPFIVREATGIQLVQLSSMGLLIMVGVILDTMKQIEGQLLMRRYEGFIK
ncbi:MAG: preprotein translocase subunit SecY [Chloroflexota bacterium]